MTELMQGDDREYRHVFQDAPAYRRISALLLNLVNGYEKPGPVQKYGDSRNLEEPNRSCGIWHSRAYYHTRQNETSWRRSLTVPEW